MSHDNVVSQALEGRTERQTGEKEGHCRKVGYRRLVSGEENRCSLDSFAAWAFV